MGCNRSPRSATLGGRRCIPPPRGPARLQQSSSRPRASLQQLEGPLRGPRQHSWMVGQRLGRVSLPKATDGCPSPRPVPGEGPCSRQSQRLSWCLCPPLRDGDGLANLCGDAFENRPEHHKELKTSSDDLFMDCFA